MGRFAIPLGRVDRIEVTEHLGDLVTSGGCLRSAAVNSVEYSVF
jgi:hypothetical protein